MGEKRLKALKDGKIVIPMLYKMCSIPYRLTPIQYIDFTSRSPDDNVALNGLLVALGMAESTLPRSAEISAEADVRLPGRKYSNIQAAVDAANPGSTITVAAGTYLENIHIDKPLTIKGAGADKTIVDGNRFGSVFTIGKNNANIDVILSGMTIKGGVGSSISVDDNDPNTYICGGGILNYCRLTVTDCSISSNTANYGYGGGIFNKGTVNLNNGTSVTQNSAYNGGGIYGNRGLINLNGGTVMSNQAAQLGGGIYTGYMGSVNVNNGTISDNIAGNNGGGIFSYGGRAYLKGGSIYNNIARNGAGVVNGGGRMTLNGALISNNTANRDGNGVGGGIMNSGELTLNSGSIDHNKAFTAGGGIWNNFAGTVTDNIALVHDNTLIGGTPDEISP
ncbi:MAG: hypothetical protein MUO26_00855 [Methanotrichaceae archaeon]|nr:hypothetical protein [Methanotrichaceae archaeon]